MHAYSSKPFASLFILLALCSLVHQVFAHTHVVGIFVNGIDKSEYPNLDAASSYMRQPSTIGPVEDLTSPFISCNDRGKTRVNGTLTVSAGDLIEPFWWHTNQTGEEFIAPSHEGPLTTWISPLEANGDGQVWVMIGSEGYWFEEEEQEWAVTRMIRNGGKNKVTIPASLEPGEYLIRFDLLALHMAGWEWQTGKQGGAQFYPNCAQIKVIGSGRTTLPRGVAIPGFFSVETPGVVFDIFKDPVETTGKSYIVPGTGVWDGTEFYSIDTCRSVISGLAPPGFCQQRPDSLSSSTSTTAQTSALGTSSSTIASEFTSVESLPRTSSSVRQPQRTSSARSRPCPSKHRHHHHSKHGKKRQHHKARPGSRTHRNAD